MTNAFNQDLYGNGVTLGESLVESMASQPYGCGSGGAEDG